MIPDRLSDEIIELIAEAIHETYRKDMDGKNDPESPSMTPWAELVETLKNSNREAAGHILEKLEIIGYTARQTDGREPGVVKLTVVEIEKLAEIEHDRWVEERLRDGWTLGKEKDVEKKVSPHLVGWGELSDDVREWDRNQTRRIPEYLAAAGMEIVRKPD